MTYLRDFVKKMLIVQVAGLAGMLISGWILTLIQMDSMCSQQNFFTYQIEHLDRTPAWFVFVMIQMAVNGFWMFKLAIIQGGLNTPVRGPYGYWGIEVPINYLKVFAVNLVVIPASLFLFMVIRHANW